MSALDRFWAVEEDLGQIGDAQDRLNLIVFLGAKARASPMDYFLH